MVSNSSCEVRAGEFLSATSLAHARSLSCVMEYIHLVAHQGDIMRVTEEGEGQDGGMGEGERWNRSVSAPLG